MKKGTCIFPALCAALLALAVILLSACAAADTTRSELEIVRELICCYRVSPTLSKQNSQRLLKELAAVNPDSAEQWEKIMDSWASYDNNMEIHEWVLPDGLTNSEGLCIVVLGYQLNADGSMKEELIGRLKAAKECAEKYPNAYILCTGGETAAASDVKEADAMADWLTENGIASHRVLTETESVTTAENAMFSAELLMELHPEISQIALVSSDYHIPWAAILFEAEFILDGQALTLVSNAVYPTTATLNSSTLLLYQTSGLLEIAKAHLG